MWHTPIHAIHTLFVKNVLCMFEDRLLILNAKRRISPKVRWKTGERHSKVITHLRCVDRTRFSV